MKTPPPGTAESGTKLGSVRLYRYILHAVNAVLLLTAVAVLEWQRHDHNAVIDRAERYHLTTIACAAVMRDELHLVEDALAARALKMRSEAGPDDQPFHVAYPGTTAALQLVGKEVANVTETQNAFRGPEFAATTSRIQQQFFDINALISGGLQQESEVEAAQKQMLGLTLSLGQLRRLHKSEHSALSSSLPLQDRHHLQVLTVIVLGLLALSIASTRRIFKFIERTRETLRESEERFRDLYEKAPTAYLTVGRDGHILGVNEKATELLGYAVNDLIDQEVFDHYADTPARRAKAREIFQHFINGERVHDEELQVRRADGRGVWIGLTVDPLRGADGEMMESRAIVIDISQRRHAEEERARLEAQLGRHQRLETIGTLAGGVAHDFNNILTPILGYTDLALLKQKETDPVFKDLQHVLKAALRAKDLVKQILLFAKEGDKEATPVRLQAIVQEALKLLRPSIPSTIDIRQQIDDSCEEVRADATQIHQVVVNLCANAAQAMEANGGVLTIELAQVTVDALTADVHPNLHQGEYVRLSVTDTGEGIDAAILERIFEPFFTTKAVDKGTGLGLSVVHGIVRSHQGDILAESTPGKGTVFHVYLPLAPVTEPTTEAESKAIPGGKESVLVVDDDELVLNVNMRMLVRLGYQVEVCGSGTEALEAFRKNPEKYDLLITDLTMPNMTGLDLSEQLQSFRPGFPSIIMTGYGESMNEETRRTHGVRQVIGKPITTSELASTIREVLDC